MSEDASRFFANFIQLFLLAGGVGGAGLFFGRFWLTRELANKDTRIELLEESIRNLDRKVVDRDQTISNLRVKHTGEADNPEDFLATGQRLDRIEMELNSRKNKQFLAQLHTLMSLRGIENSHISKGADMELEIIEEWLDRIQKFPENEWESEKRIIYRGLQYALKGYNKSDNALTALRQYI